MKVEQTRTYVLRDVTEQELNDLSAALMITIFEYSPLPGSKLESLFMDDRRRRMEGLARVINEALAGEDD